MKDFRSIQKPKEILALLQQAPSDDLGQIWQSQDQSRQIYNITSVGHDEGNKAIVFETLKDFDLSGDFPIYIRMNYRDLIFKLTGKSCVINGHRLICRYPKVAKAIEERMFERFQVPAYKKCMVLLKSLGKSAIEVRVRLVDYSKTGVGIVISELDRGFMEKIKRFEIVTIDDLLLHNHLEITLSYIRKSSGLLRAGFKLKKPLPDALFQTLTKLINI
jgi:hypothetical protein